jgi:putative copper export protein/methionine-rich copper-binding protein CopC/outer membrane protein assembly factor BamB
VRLNDRVCGMTDQHRCRWGFGRSVLLTGVALLALLLLPEPHAMAHAVFVSATPQPGSRLSTPPASVRIAFSEPLDANLSGIDVYTSSGRVVTARSAGVDPTDPTAYVDHLQRLRPDRYAVIWHTVSAIDGHSRRGSYTFTVDRADGSAPRVGSNVVAAPNAPEPPPTWVQAVVRWIGLVGLFALAGFVLVTTLGPGTGVLEFAGIRRRLQLLSYLGCGALLLGTFGDVVSAWVPLGRGAAGLPALLVSTAGRWWEIRLAAVLVVLCCVPRAVPRRRAAGRGCVLAAGVGVVALSYAATSHGAATATSGAGLAYEFVHVLAASIWLGGAAAVAAIWTVARRDGIAGSRRLLRRYSITAGVAVPAVLLSGLGNAVLELGNLGDLVSTSYGTSLLVKLAVLALLIAVAAVNAIVLKPAFDADRSPGRRLDRTITIEALLGLVVLAPTAVLAILAPSRPSDTAHDIAARVQAQIDPANTFSGSAQLRGHPAAIDVTPGAIGTNAVRVEIAGVDNDLRLELQCSGADGSDTAHLTRTGFDHDPATHTIYQGAIQLTHPGLQRAILRPVNGGAPSVPIPIVVSARHPGDQPAQSPVTRWLAMIALTGLAVALIAAARAVPNRRLRSTAIATGAVGLSVAVVWAATVGLGPSAARPAGWAAARPVPALTIGDGRVWRMPTPAAGVMMPATAPDGSIWVAEMDSNKLARLDPAGDVVQEFRFPGAHRESMGVAVTPDGRVWVAQEHAMALGMFDPATGNYREFPIPGPDSAPLGVAAGPDGTIWFTETSGNSVASFDPRTAKFTEYAVPTSDALPYWVTVGGTGRVWFTEFGAGKLGSLDPRTGHVREYPVPGAPNLAGIAVARDGTVWFASCQGTLFALDPTSGRLRHIRLPAAGDYGVAAGPNGLVWVGRNGGRTVFAVDPVTGRARSYELPAGSAPWWPVVDGAGHVWVALAGAGGNGLAELHQPA